MKRNKGFTLIELLAVIVILAIIALVATPMVLKYIDKSKEGADENSLKAIETAAELYYTSSILKGENPKIIYFPDDNNVLGLKGEKPTDGMVAFFNDGRIKVIATINNTTYISETSKNGSYFNATGSVTATDKEWEYEKINDTDVTLTKYIGYKYRYVNDLNNFGVLSEKTYNAIIEKYPATESVNPNKKDSNKIYPTLFIFPSRLKTSDGKIYNVKSIKPKSMNDGGSCKPAYGLFNDISIITSCVNGVSNREVYQANYFDKIVVSEGITEIGMIFESMDAKEISLPSTLKTLGPLTDYYGFTNGVSLTNLEQLVIPSNIETIESKTIQNDQKSLKNIVFEGVKNNTSKLNTIQPEAFYLDHELQNVTIYVPGTIKNIYSNSFETYNSNATTTRLNIVIKNNNCSNYSLINSDYVRYTCEI